jgi:hypothetical protein
MSEFKKMKVTILQGVLGDMAVDQLGWLSQEEQDNFWRDHNAHVADLKTREEYAKPIEIEINMELDPLYDMPKQPKGAAIESYRFEILNVGEDE